MSTTYKNIKIPYPTEGVIRTAQLNDTVAPDDSVEVAVNMNFDRVGAAQTRLGLANSGANSISGGLYAMGTLSTKPATGIRRLLAQTGLLRESIASWAGGANWTIVRTLNTVVPVFISSDTHQATKSALFAGSIITFGQSFTSAYSAVLDNVSFKLDKYGAPTGNANASIYAITGIFGVNSKPTGPALAVSDNFNVATLTTSLQDITFNFSGANRISLNSGTNYVVTITYNGGDSSNAIEVGWDNVDMVSPGNFSWSLNNTNWTGNSSTDLTFSVTGISTVASKKARFSQFLDYTWMVNGNAGDAIQTFNGFSFGTTLVPATLPKGDFIHGGFEGRVWVADKDQDIIYYTDIVQFTPPSTYVLTFDITTNYIKNFSPQDGQYFTGLFRVPRALLAFKQDSIYRIYGATSVDNYPAYNVGTYSQESIIQAKDGIYFHHSSGFYKFTYDSQPTEISRRVIDFVKAIPRTSYENICGVYDGFDNIEWSVGSLTVEGVTYSSCVMRYTISTQVWTIYDYIGNDITSMITYDDGNAIHAYAGTSNYNGSNGRLGILDYGLTDFGEKFYFELVDRWRSFTDMYAKAKAISGINVYTENAAGTDLQYQTEKTPPNVWHDIDTIDTNYDALFPNASTDDFANIRLRLKGYSSGTPIVYHGMEVLSIQDKGFNQN